MFTSERVKKGRYTVGGLISLVGKKFGDLTVEKQVGIDTWGKGIYLCKCKCGNTRRLAAQSLTRKRFPSTHCGCKTPQKNRKERGHGYGGL